MGTPATVVFSTNLSQPAILAGIRSGGVFIDLEGASPGRLLDMRASTKAGVTAVMGETLLRPKGKMVVDAHVRVAGAAGCIASLIVGGSRLPTASAAITKADQIRDFPVPLVAATRWFRVDVRNKAGRRVMIGNPIFVR